MKRYLNLGLIGYPLEHSLSPRLHQAAMRATGLAGEYHLYPVPPVPQGTAGLVGLVARLRSGEIDGLNVTIPHKQSILPLLDRLSPTAEQIGAVNTLYLQDGRVTGDNTDAAGFWTDLKNQAGAAELNGGRAHRALVLGAGGAARAVVYALAQAGWQVTLAARRTGQAEELLDSLGIHGQVVSLDPAGLVTVDQIDALVNATPLGMTPRVAACPWPEQLELPAGAIVYDLVYNPQETRLLARARSAGLRAFSGVGMLVEQAALAFQCWTGLDAPRPALWQGLQTALSQKAAV